MSSAGSETEVISKYFKWIMAALFCAGFIFIIYVCWLTYQFISDFNNGAQLLNQKYGINIWLSKIISLIFSGALAIGIIKSIKSFWSIDDASPRGILGWINTKNGTRISTIIVASLYYLMMFSISRDVNFSHSTSEALKWCAETPEGQKARRPEGQKARNVTTPQALIQSISYG